MDLDFLFAGPLIIGVAFLVALVVVFIVNFALTRVGRRLPMLGRTWRRVRRPLIVLFLAVVVWIAFSQAIEASTFRDVGMHVLLIMAIVAAVWLVETIVLAWIDQAQRKVIARMRGDDRAKRRAETQLGLIRRIIDVTFGVLGVALVLLTFPGVEKIGGAMLASAGVLSVVLGVAAQSTLGNVFAGLQLAFTDAIRIGDVVEVDGTWSTVEDVTLTYVVVAIWDERHKVLPSTYFTTTPFINWSRTGDTVTGTVTFSLDWRVDLEGMRAEFERVLDESGLWDGRARNLLVTDSATDRLTVRLMMTTANTDDDWTLRCLVREKIATWLRARNPEALPIQRVIIAEPEQNR